MRFYGDMHNLRLRVLPSSRKNPSGGKNWTQRLTIQGKRRDLGLGTYPYVSLEDARALAFENQRLAKRGEDPTKLGATFAYVAAAKLALDAPTVAAVTHRKQRTLLDQHAMPSIRKLRIADVETHHVMDVIEPIWITANPTAEHVLNLLSRIFDYAIAKGYITSNPATASILKAALPKIRKSSNGTKHEHLAALPHDQVAAALAKIEASGTALANIVKFLALTAVRSSEARLADWSEIDLQEKLWTIPAEHMKTRREHVVPLSDQACEILSKQQAVRPTHCKLVFPGRNYKGVGEASLRNLFGKLNLGTVHGLRSSFRDWGSEVGQDRDLLELCLSHAVGSQTERPSWRSTMLERRRAVMQAWSDYVS